MTTEQFAVVIPALGVIVGVLIGTFGAPIAAALEFNRQKGEQRRNELRRGYKRTWLLIHNYALRINYLRVFTRIQVEDETPGKHIVLDANYKKEMPFDKAILYLLIYVPNGEELQKTIRTYTDSLYIAYTKLTDTADKEKQQEIYSDISEISTALILVFEKIESEVIDLLHKL